MKRLSVLSLLLVLVLAACQPIAPRAPTAAVGEGQAEMAAEAAPAQPDAGAVLQGLLDEQVREQGILGMAMAVRLPDGTVIARGAGATDPEGQAPWSPETQTALGSITKTFTAVIIMQLVEEGLLSLDDTMDQWFPEQPNGDKITVRMLLSHTSGLANYISGENNLDPKWAEEWAPEALLAEANLKGPVGEAGGAVAHYSNTGYAVLGMMIEAITGKRWEQEVQSRILAPLGMRNTTFLGEEGVWNGSMIKGYAKTADGYISSAEIPNYPHASTTWAAGAVVSTLADLMTFAGALFDGDLVSRQTLAEMGTAVAPDDTDPMSWGLGGATLEHIPGSFGMGGDIPGYHAFFVGVQNSGLVVAALINTEEGDVIAPSMMALESLLSMSPAAGESSAAVPQQPDPGAALQGLLDEQVEQQGILGMIMAARLPDGTVIDRNAGTADREGNVAWTMDTQSALGSITKTFSAVVIMQMIEEGLLSLDDTIDKWFPDQPNGERITVRMLLSHSSGLDNFIQPENERDPMWSREWTPEELVAMANEAGPVGAPGSNIAHYANTNFTLLGLIVEAITGNRWEDEVRARIFEPLGLKDTAFVDDEGVWGGTLTPGYSKMAGGYISTLEIPDLPSASTGWAVGSVVSSLADLMTFASALFDGKLVSEESLAAMATGIAPDPDGVRIWGLGGATLKGVPGSYGMGGDNPGYRAIFVGQIGTPYVVAGLINTEGGDVVGPALQVFQYLASLPPAGPQP